MTWLGRLFGPGLPPRRRHLWELRYPAGPPSPLARRDAPGDLAEHLALMRHDGRPDCGNREHTDLLRRYGRLKAERNQALADAAKAKAHLETSRELCRRLWDEADTTTELVAALQAQVDALKAERRRLLLPPLTDEEAA